jgi:6-phosphogluconolactonase
VNEISSLGVTSTGLTLLSKVSSGGSFPISVALAGNLVHVLNARGTPNITGFRLHPDGTLQALPGSTRDLPGGDGAVPRDVRFTPDGTRLLVTEQGTNQIDIFELGNNGLVTDVSTQPSSGAGPFGFTFGRDGVLVVLESTGGSVSSYRLTSQNSLNVISASVPNGQDPCWISLTRDGHAFISNPARGTLSSYQVAADGHLTLVNAVAAAPAGSAPIDSALSSDSKLLYVVDSALGRVLIFRVNGDNLASVGSVTGLPTTVQGIAAQ